MNKYYWGLEQEVKRVVLVFSDNFSNRILDEYKDQPEDVSENTIYYDLDSEKMKEIYGGKNLKEDLKGYKIAVFEPKSFKGYEVEHGSLTCICASLESNIRNNSRNENTIISRGYKSIISYISKLALVNEELNKKSIISKPDAIVLPTDLTPLMKDNIIHYLSDRGGDGFLCEILN